MEIVSMGMVLDEREQAVWVKANANPAKPHSEVDFEAVLAEHTEATSPNEPSRRKIPAANYERASSVLGQLIVRYGRGPFSSAETSKSVQTAQAMIDAISDNLPPCVQSADNSAA